MSLVDYLFPSKSSTPAGVEYGGAQGNVLATTRYRHEVPKLASFWEIHGVDASQLAARFFMAPAFSCYKLDGRKQNLPAHETSCLARRGAADKASGRSRKVGVSPNGHDCHSMTILRWHAAESLREKRAFATFRMTWLAAFSPNALRLALSLSVS